MPVMPTDLKPMFILRRKFYMLFKDQSDGFDENPERLPVCYQLSDQGSFLEITHLDRKGPTVKIAGVRQKCSPLAGGSL